MRPMQSQQQALLQQQIFHIYGESINADIALQPKTFIEKQSNIINIVTDKFMTTCCSIFIWYL